MQRNYPSVKRIAEVCRVDRATAKNVRGIMDGTIKVRENPDFPKTFAWQNQCYNPLGLHELKLSAIDETLGTFGVEVVGDCGCYPPRIDLEYCNTGDTYAGTVCYANGRYFVGSWGDYVEQHNL